MTQAVTVIESDEPGVFGALSLQGLDDLRMEYGRESEIYGVAAESTRALFESAIANDKKLSLALITFPSTLSFSTINDKRQQPPEQSPFPLPSPQQPISGISTCFTTAEACGNATDGCSGHGSCLQANKIGRMCFVCACSATKDDETGKLEEWAGEACERKDISS
jgi:hypothetical protein